MRSITEYEIDYHRDGRDVRKARILTYDRLNIDLKWIKGDYYNSIIITRIITIIEVDSNYRVYKNSKKITFTEYMSSTLRYREYWNLFHANQITELKEQYKELADVEIKVK